jgi:hypothetical protein
MIIIEFRKLLRVVTIFDLLEDVVLLFRLDFGQVGVVLQGFGLSLEPSHLLQLGKEVVAPGDSGPAGNPKATSRNRN